MIRLRGTKKSDAKNDLSLLRKRTVEAIQERGVNVKGKHKAIEVPRWAKLGPKSDPRKDGLFVKRVNLPGKGFTDCVLLRKAVSSAGGL